MSKEALVIESILNGTFFTLERFQKHNIGLIGSFAFIFLPAIDAIRTLLYWQKTRNPKYRAQEGKNRAYRTLTMIIHIFKTMVSTAAIGLIIAGLAPIGFSALVLANALMSVRSLGKACYHLYHRDYPRAGKHFLKAIIGGLFTAAFAVTFLFPPVTAAYPFLGFALAMGAATLGLGAWLVSKFTKLDKKDAKPVEKTVIAPPCEALIKQCADLKRNADLALSAFKVKERETVAQLLTRSNDKTLETMIKTKIANFVDGEMRENGTHSVSPLSTIFNPKQTPYYTKDIIPLLDAADKGPLKKYYFDTILKRTVCDLTNESYEYNPAEITNECGRNEIATNIVDALKQKKLDEFLKYNAYDTLRRVINPMASAARELEDPESNEYKKTNQADLMTCKGGHVWVVETALDALKENLAGGEVVPLYKNLIEKCTDLERNANVALTAFKVKGGSNNETLAAMTRKKIADMASGARVLADPWETIVSKEEMAGVMSSQKGLIWQAETALDALKENLAESKPLLFTKSEKNDKNIAVSSSPKLT